MLLIQMHKLETLTLFYCVMGLNVNLGSFGVIVGQKSIWGHLGS